MSGSMDMVEQDPTPSTVWLDEWLGGLRLSQYKKNLYDKGYDVPAAVAKLDSDKLEALGITKIGHKDALIDAIKQLNAPSFLAVDPNNNSVASQELPFLRLEYAGDEPHTTVVPDDIIVDAQLVGLMGVVLPYISKFDIPVVQVYDPINPNYIQPGLQCALKDKTVPNFLLLEGHLGDKESQSKEVDQIYRYFAEEQKPSAVRIRGPSGSGKTKAIFDILRASWGIYIDWSQSQSGDITSCLDRIRSYVINRSMPQEAREYACAYELVVLYAARLTVLYLFLAAKKLHQEQGGAFSWLLMQLNGLVSVGKQHYNQILLPVRNFLRRTFRDLDSLKSYFQAKLSQLSRFATNADSDNSLFVIALDEVNTLSRLHIDEFRSMDLKTRRPLIAFVLQTTYALPGQVLVSGTNKIQDHYDFFASMYAKPRQEWPRNLHDVNMGPLSTADATALQHAVFRHVPREVASKMLQDGQRPRTITAFAGVADTGTFAGVRVDAGTIDKQYLKYREYLVEGLPASEKDVVTLQHYVKQFATNGGSEKLLNLIIQDAMSPDGFTLAKQDFDYLNSNLLFITKNSEDTAAEAFTVGEALVVEAIKHYLKMSHIDVAQKYAEGIINSSLNPQGDGIKIEILICMYLTAQPVKLSLPNGLQFDVSTAAVDYKYASSLSSWLHTRDRIIRCATSVGIDVLLPLQLARGDLNNTFNIQVGSAPSMPWVCIGVLAAKTTQRAGRTVDGRDVALGIKTSSFEQIYTNREGGELEEHTHKKTEALQKLLEISRTANVLLVRYHINFPGPSRNSYATKRADLVLRESLLLPVFQTGAARQVNINFQNLNSQACKLALHEITVSVDIDSVAQFGLLSADIVQILQSKFPLQKTDTVPTNLNTLPPVEVTYNRPPGPLVEEQTSGTKRKR